MPTFVDILGVALLTLAATGRAFLLTTTDSTKSLASAIQSTITPPPTLVLEKRQSSPTGPSFIGLYNSNDTYYETLSCESTGFAGEWSVSDTWGGCFTQTGGSWYSGTSCTDVACATSNGFACGTATIIQQSPWSGSTWFWVNCWKLTEWSAWTLYRELGPTSTSSVHQTTQTNTPVTSTADPSPSPSPSSSNDQSWIAAAVIVPVVVITMACFGVWFLRHRKSHQKQHFTAGRDDGDRATEMDEHGRIIPAEMSASQPSYELSQAASVDRSRRTAELQG